MANGTNPRTDPLAPYGQARPAARQTVKSKAPWWERVALPAATVASLPFSSGAQEDVGTFVGNQISRVPGLRDVVGAAPEGAVSSVSNFVRMGTGNKELTDAGTELSKGNIPGFLSNLAFGGAQLYGAGSFGAARAGAKLFSPYNLLGKTRFGGPVRSLVGSIRNAPVRAALGAGVTGALTDFSGPQGMAATPELSPTGRVLTQEESEAMGRGRMGVAGGFGATSQGATSGVPEVGGLSVAQQLQFDNQLRDIEAETAAILSGLGQRESSARAETKEGREQSRRQVAGSSQDIASQLAFLGLDTSPGVADVGQEFEARTGARREQALAKGLAETIGDISARRAEQQRLARTGRSDVAARRLAAEQENIDKQRERNLMNIILGGGR